jgi:peptidoglycan/xylan/chitin deacetylase (PgdA/CDA1 family)
MRIKKRLLDGLNWARSRFSKNSAILLYHRVAPKQRDQFGLCVTPTNFDQQIASISEIGTPLSLSELVGQNRRGQLKANSIAVTFDDGYLDVLENAIPILERYEVPATIFIVTGNFGKPFWWDRLADLIVHSQKLPESIRLGSEDLPTGGGSRARLLKKIYPTVRAMPPQQRDEELTELAQVIGHSAGLENERAMDVSELRSLARHPLITLGAHTVTHSQLASLSIAEQEKEIASSVRDLEEVIGQAVNTFSYPFGIRSRDYNSDTIAAARKAGLDHAIAADLNVVTKKADDFAIPRLWIHDWDGPKFRKNLSRWL